ncbi:MAG: xanthine dehydrogenase family protein [Proteobacteria bacterium]|nr:xanthine dehydrogenase family protein [Pseudomonadota bacterium]
MYVDDLQFDGMLYGATVRSRQAHARYLGYELDPDYDWTDITVVTHEAIPGGNYVALMVDDQPALVSDLIRHPSEPVVLLAAPTREQAEEARAHVKLLVEPLPIVVDLEAARAGAGPIWGDDNIISHLEIQKGDGPGCVDKALAEHPDAILVEGRYYTGAQEQMYIEPQGIIAMPWGKGGIEILGSLQCPYYVVKALAQLLDVPAAEIKVVQAVTGGGFGGKEDYPSIISAHASLLALATGKPVKLVYDRAEDLSSTTRRHPAITWHRTAVAPDGTLLAMEVDCAFDGGAYTTLSPVVLSRALIHGVGPYNCEHAMVTGDIVATNTPPNGAFRGFGAPQVCFASERHIDKIAATLGRDPVALRRQLALRIGDTTLTGQTLETSVASDEVLDVALEASDWDRRRAEAEAINARGGVPPADPIPGMGTTGRLRGVGMSFFFHGAGFTGNGEARIKGRVRMEVRPDGQIVIYSASTDIGQGTRTVFPQLAATTLGVGIERIEMHTPDTSVVPDSGPTVASRTLMVVGKVVEDCSNALKARMGFEGGDWDAAVDAFFAGGGDGSVELEYQTPPHVEWDNETYQGEAYPCYAWACDVVEVEVCPDTYETRITGFWSAQDVGKAIHPVLVSGQLEGGSLQALGFAVLEEMKFADGQLTNNRMTNCIIPTALDAPEMDMRLVEAPFAGGPFGAKGIGELPMDGGAPAVLAAIEHATGLSLDSLPASPEALMRAAAE